MKLTFKDLKQQKFVIEAEPSETVLQVKEKISGEKGWEAGQQKLIYSGKILKDADTIESYNVEEKGFIVCMVSKVRGSTSSVLSVLVDALEAQSSTRIELSNSLHSHSIDTNPTDFRIPCSSSCSGSSFKHNNRGSSYSITSASGGYHNRRRQFQRSVSPHPWSTA